MAGSKIGMWVWHMWEESEYNRFCTVTNRPGGIKISQGQRRDSD